jgi:hypothetical protein
VLLNAATLRGLEEGTVSRTYRRWTAVRVKPGSRLTTRSGVVEVRNVSQVDAADLTDQDAGQAGFDSLAALLAWTRSKGAGDLYRVDLALIGPDPRVALRLADDLSMTELADLDARLDRMDRAAERPWTRQVLEQIRRRPAVVSTELAAEAGQERAAYKIRVRRLKALGLTESLEIGYRLSPRAEAYLQHHDRQRNPLRDLGD